MEMIHSMSKYKLGVFALLLSAVFTSISQVFYASQVQGVSPFLFTGISFFITACYFQIFTLKQRLNINWKASIGPLVKLNIASALTFLSFYFALKYVEPAIVSSLEMGIAPLFILSLLLFQRKAVAKIEWIIGFGTLFACILLIVAVFNNSSAVKASLNEMTIIALFASIICGIGAVYCSQYSKALNDLGWTSSMILSKRYIIVIIVSFIMTYDEIPAYLFDNLLWIIVVTVGGVLIPNYLLQKGIQYTTTFVVMMSLSFIPVFTFVCQLFDTRLQFSYTTLIGVIVLFICGMLTIMRKN